MKRLLVILILLCGSAFGQSFGPVYITTTSSPTGGCAQIDTTSNKGTVGIQVTGTWTGTLQPELQISATGPPVNVSVTPVGSTTAQTTITANGSYTTGVSGATTFLLCGPTATGTAQVYLTSSTAVARNGTGTGSGGSGITFPITVPQGGTGDTTLTAHGVLIGEGVANVNVTAAGALNQCFIGQGVGADPIFAACPAPAAPSFSVITTGVNNAAAMTVGTGASLAASGTGTIAATSVPLNGVTAAVASATINSLNFPITWNWAQTTDAQDALAFGESAAATGGTLTSALANQALHSITTLTGSTETPLEVQQGSVTGTVAFPALQVETTWNNAGLTGEGILFSLTNTSSAAGSLLEDLRLNGTTLYGFNTTGTATFGQVGAGGVLALNGSTSGTATIAAPAVAGAGTNPFIFSNGLTAPFFNATSAATAYQINAVTVVALPTATSIAVGPGALAVNTSTLNTAVGNLALTANTSGSQNTAVGNNSLQANITGGGNTAVGFVALTNSTASNNTGVGNGAGNFITTGGNNTALGNQALQGITGNRTTGTNNTAIGSFALSILQGAAPNNTAVGFSSGSVCTTCSQVSLLGASSNLNAATDINEIVIGYNTTGVGTNTATIGNASVTAVWHGSATGVASINGAAFQSKGTTFTASGCTNSSLAGGATAGKYVSGTTGTCTVVITMGNTMTASNGWACYANDLTTVADTQKQSATTTTTATLTGTTVTGDTINFGCIGY